MAERQAGPPAVRPGGSAEGRVFDFDRHSEAGRGLAGVVYVAKVYGPEAPEALWKARCGWRFGRKACKEGRAWRILKADEDVALAACM